MKKKSESGQAIVLIVLAVVGLMGFTSLAIDGGKIYSDRRHAQSASDAASLTGGGQIAFWLNNNFIFIENFSCADGRIADIMRYGRDQARIRANHNDYANPQITVTTFCEDNGPFHDPKYIDITTHLVRDTDTSFIHIVYGGATTQQVESTVRVRPTQPLALGHAIVALNEDACQGNQNGVILGGSHETEITGGGILSNGCLRCDGMKGDEDDPPVEVDGGSVVYGGTVVNCESDDINPDPTQQDPITKSTWSIEPPPNCSHPNAVTIDSIKKGMTLNENTLYCITSDKTAIGIHSKDLTGRGVTLYLVNGGDVTINGGEVTLIAPPREADVDPAIGGVLIYVPEEYESTIKITGNVESHYFGAIFAPGSDVEIAGTSGSDSVDFHTQIIAKNVHITGNADVNLYYDDDQAFLKPAYLDMLE